MIVTYVPGDFNITTKALTITAEDKSKCYNGAVYGGGYTVTYDGFISGEDESDLGGTLGFSGAAITAVSPGDYTITPEGLTSDNYDISFVDGTLTIYSLPAPVITGPATVSINTTAIYSTPFTGGHTYSWSVSGGVIQGASNASVVTILWGNDPGVGELNVTDINTITGCSAPSDPYYVTISEDPILTYKISGLVTYYNISNPNIPMDLTTLTLVQGTTAIATATTSATGYYEFTNVPDGTYEIEVSTTKASGGVSPLDAGTVNYWWTHRTPIEQCEMECR